MGYKILAAIVPIVPCNGTDCNICHLFIGVKNIINFLLIDVAFPLAVIAFLYGGIKLITSRGSESDVTKGRQAIWLAFIGLIIAFGAWLLIDLIMGNLLDPGYLPWNKFPTGC